MISRLRAVRTGGREGWLWALALAPLAVLAAFTAWLGARALSHPYQLLYGEGFLLEFARRLWAGEPLYKPLDQFPLGTCNYPPIPLLLARFTFPILGFGYAAGRIWALLAALLVAIVLFLWVRRATAQTLPAAAASLAWLGAPSVYQWAPQFRVDLPGLALSLAGLYVVWRIPRRGALALAAPLFVLGLYCKQSFVAAPAAAIAALALSRRFREAGILAGLVLLLGGIPFVALVLSSHGAFWTSMVTANVNLFEPGRLAAQLGNLLRTYPVLVLLASLALAWQLLGIASRAVPPPLTLDEGRPAGGWIDLRQHLITLYLILAVATIALAGKAGSWENYFLEPLAALCLGSGLALASLRSSRAALRAVAPLLLLLQAAAMWHTPAAASALLRSDAAANQALHPTIAAAPGLILSEDAGLLVQAGKPVPYYDFQLTQLALAGRWDQRWELEHLRGGAFDMVIFEYDSRLNVEQYGRYTRDFMSALDYGYHPATEVGKYRIYRPAPLDRLRTVRFQGGLALVGHTLSPATLQAGDTLALDVVWQATQPPAADYTSFLHLLDQHGQGWAGDDHAPWDGLYPTTRWAANEMVRLRYRLTLPPDLPPGLYSLLTGWYDDDLVRLQTETGVSAVPLAVVQVVDPGSAPPQSEGTRLDSVFGPGIHLEQVRLSSEPGRLQVELVWWTEEFLPVDYTVFVHLRSDQKATVAQGDGPPAEGAWPTSLWPPGVRIADIHTLAPVEGPPDARLPAGEYELVVGLYDPRSGARLPLSDGSDAQSLGRVHIP
jgi:hypothetical protein